jgi:hypothetical protein
VRTRWRSFATDGLWVLVTLGLATVAVTVLEDAVGVPNASALYLVSVVLCGLAAGEGAVILAAIGASHECAGFPASEEVEGRGGHPRRRASTWPRR